MDEKQINRVTRAEDLPEVLTMALVARVLGCSLTSAYGLLKKPDFPHTVLGQRIYVDKGKFLVWIDAQIEKSE